MNEKQKRKRAGEFPDKSHQSWSKFLLPLLLSYYSHFKMNEWLSVTIADITVYTVYCTSLRREWFSSQYGQFEVLIEASLSSFLQHVFTAVDSHKVSEAKFTHLCTAEEHTNKPDIFRLYTAILLPVIQSDIVLFLKTNH